MRRVIPTIKFGSLAEYNILPDEWAWSAEDRTRFIRLLAEQDLACTNLAAYIIWNDVSDDACAGWLIPGDNDADVLERLRRYFTVGEEVREFVAGDVVRLLLPESFDRLITTPRTLANRTGTHGTVTTAYPHSITQPITYAVNFSDGAIGCYFQGELCPQGAP